MGTSYYNLSFSSGTYNLNAGITVNGNLTLSGGTLNAGSQTINLYGNWTDSGGTFTAGSSTLQLLGTGTSIISGAVAPNGFNAVTSTAAGKTIEFTSGTTQTLGVFTITGTPASNIYLVGTTAAIWTIDVTSSNVSYANIIYSTVSPGQTANYSTNSGNNTGWTFQTFKAWTGGAGTTAWNTAGNWSPAAVPVNTDNVTIDPAAFQPVLNVAASFATLSIAPGATLDLAGLGVTQAAAGTVAVNGTLKMQGGETLTNVTGITGTGTVQLYGAAGPYTVPNFSYYALTISGAGTFNLGAALAVASDFTVSAGTLNAGANAITVGGNLNFTGIAAFSGTGLVTMSPAGAVTLRSGGVTLPALTVGSGTVNLGVALTLSGTLSISAGAAFSSSGLGLTIGGSFADNGTATLAAGTVTFDASSGTNTISGTSPTTFPNLAVSVTGGALLQLGQSVTIAPSSSLTIAAGAILDLNGNNLTFGGGDTFTNSGTFELKGGETITNQPAGAVGGTVNYYGTGAFTSLPAGLSYTNLTLSAAGATSRTLQAGSLSVTATLTIGANETLNVGPDNFTVGTLSNSGTFELTGDTAATHSITTPNPTSGTFQYTGAGAATIYHFGPPDYYDLSVTGSGTFATAAALVVSGNYTQSAGTVNAGSTITVAGGLTLNGGTLAMGANGLNVAGNITAAGGAATFTGVGTLTLDGAAAQAVNLSSSTIQNLTLTTGTKTVTATGAINVGGNLEVQANQTLAMGANNLGVTGTTNAVAGGVGTITSTSGTQLFTGNFKLGSLTASSVTTSFAGATVTLTSFTANGGTVQFTGTVAVAFTTAGQNLNSLSLIDNGAKTVTVTGALNVGGNLEVQATQILAMGAGNLAVTGTTNAAAGALVGTITSTSGTQVFTGNFQLGSLTASSATTGFAGATVTLTSFTANGGTVQFTGTVAVAFTTAGQNLNSLSLIDNGAKTVTVAGALNVGGNLELQATEILAMGAGNLAVTGTTNACGRRWWGPSRARAGRSCLRGTSRWGA